MAADKTGPTGSMGVPGEPRRLDVSGAIERGALRSATVVHRADDDPTIDSIALVTRPEQARRVAPRAAVVVAAGIENRGWFVSAVLRFAWERRASVVVAPGDQPDSVLALARRLDVTLLSVAEDPTAVALALAADIGAADAAVEAQLVELLRDAGRAASVDALLRIASARLGDRTLQLRFGDRVVVAAGPAEPAGEPLAPLAVTRDTDAVTLHAFPGTSPGERAFMRSAVELLLPLVRAVWWEAGSQSRVDGVTALAAADDLTLGVSGAALERLGWSEEDFHFVVFLHPRRTDRPAGLGAVVRLVWQRAMGRAPLAETPRGWVAVLPADDEEAMADLVDGLRERAAAALADLGIAVGVSTLEAEPERLPDLVREARAAAKAAGGAGPSSVGSFEELGIGVLGHLLDVEEARAVGRLVVPAFCDAPDRTVLSESVSAFLAAGSVTAAADAQGIHRNTLTARLDRARALGLPVGDPSATLPILVLLRALDPFPEGDHG